MTNKILKGVDKYYSEKITEFGLTPQGVDWNSKESQYLRFEQLCNVLKSGEQIRLLDFGCGYGELCTYLSQALPANSFTYYGFDISSTMISYAKQLHKKNDNAGFFEQLPDGSFDYVIASGIFNVRLDLANDDEWQDYIIKTLTSLNELSDKGFSFNALTKYSDSEHMRSYLYYADPLWLFDYCKKNFSRKVALLHDYDLYEFTIIVRK